ncbi:hypothetical protein [Variovorax sp.]|uniref:hypothetical protein n=1 Tax=Variovorax sp. TaxID=1871043 RepID=UPI002D7108B2|nr:hypothetical protein [Variovorax sp.]HYP84151.1 hypothetical protein [Variovorax sp.]
MKRSALRYGASVVVKRPVIDAMLALSPFAAVCALAALTDAANAIVGGAALAGLTLVGTTILSDSPVRLANIGSYLVLSGLSLYAFATDLPQSGLYLRAGLGLTGIALLLLWPRRDQNATAT